MFPCANALLPGELRLPKSLVQPIIPAKSGAPGMQNESLKKGGDHEKALGFVAFDGHRHYFPIDFCINNGIIGTGGIRLCPDRVEALIYWKIGASGLWLC